MLSKTWGVRHQLKGLLSLFLFCFVPIPHFASLLLMTDFNESERHRSGRKNATQIEAEQPAESNRVTDRPRQWCIA